MRGAGKGRSIAGCLSATPCIVSKLPKATTTDRSAQKCCIRSLRDVRLNVANAVSTDGLLGFPIATDRPAMRPVLVDKDVLAELGLQMNAVVISGYR